MNEISVLLTFFILIIRTCSANDVLGCGGFIKSHVQIDFSKVEVKLFTKHGIIKDKTNCAPNGYYFVPLYDKGEYVLQLEPPAGWSFNPTKVNLHVDGETDLCSQGKDINFVFKGFGITGKVESAGPVQGGPQGVQVELKSNTDVRTTTTDENGSFFFTPVYPGTYTVSISHEHWKIHKKSLVVTVTEGNTDLPPKSLLVQGYDVVGAVKSEGEPVRDTLVLLYQKGNKANALIDGCNKDVSSLPLENKPICYVTTDEKGAFTIGTVPVGDYFLKPYYKEQNIHFRPFQIDFHVEHSSVRLSEAFEIIGFNMVGYVLKSDASGPIAGAEVYVNDKKAATTGADGSYTLDKLHIGNYKLTATVAGFRFNDLHTKITPNAKKLPDLVPHAHKVCGHIVSDQSQTITFTKIGSTTFLKTMSDAKNGSFCEYLTRGKYDVQVVVDSDNKQKGLQFFPIKQTIDVNFDQVAPILFSQLKATLSGKVQCIERSNCDGLKVNLKPIGMEQNAPTVVSITDNTYTVSNIYPGNYEITLAANKYCWKSSKQVVNVNSANVVVAPFVQTGYTVHFVSSHSVNVNYKLSGSEVATSIDVPKGRTSYCLEKVGSYTFELKSCHDFEQNTITFNTNSDNNEIVLNAKKHTVKLAVKAIKNYGNLEMSVKIANEKRIMKALYQNGQYELSLLLSPSESVVIVPQSNILYFTPPILSISGRDDCAHLGVQFEAVEGRVFKGKIVPPLAGVQITVDTENSDSLLTETDSNGFYEFPPLDDTKQYAISAKKDSYVLVGPNESGDFSAQKLAEIQVEVVSGADNRPLHGALLSLSGGESYRSNLQTNDNGKITFHSLSPNQYFLKPMMKEYQFEPASKIIQVKEGETVNIKLVGKRVAYSAFGQVMSLNGVAEENVIIVAVGTKNCTQFSEESTSEASGLFRIRGLQPYCSYDVSIKRNLDEKTFYEQSSNAIRVESVANDVNELKLIVFKPKMHTDVLVKVFAENIEYYKNLKVKIARESPPSGLVTTLKVDANALKLNTANNKGIVIQALSVPMDGKSYSMQLESSVSQVKWKPKTHYFNANATFKYIELDFYVKSSVSEQNIKQTSIWTLLMIFIAIGIFANIDFVFALLRDKFKLNVNLNGLSGLLASSKKTNDYYDNAAIDQIVQSINNVKRKPKPKKA